MTNPMTDAEMLQYVEAILRDKNATRSAIESLLEPVADSLRVRVESEKPICNKCGSNKTAEINEVTYCRSCCYRIEDKDHA